MRFKPKASTGINNGAEGLNVEIYTYRRTLYVNFSEETNRKVLEIFDLNGRLQLRRELPEGLQFSQLLDLSDGIYLVRLTSGASTHWQKVLVR